MVVDLKQVVLMLANGGGGVLVYWMLENWPPFLVRWYGGIARPDIKRWIAAGMTAAVAVVFWGLAVGFGYIERPAGDWQGWLTAVLNCAIGAAVAFEAATIAHTKVLKARWEERGAEKQRPGVYRSRRM